MEDEQVLSKEKQEWLSGLQVLMQETGSKLQEKKKELLKMNRADIKEEKIRLETKKQMAE